MLAFFLLYVLLVWIFSCCDWVQITGAYASCVLYIICSQFITFEQVTFCSTHCAWFIALLTSPYAILLRTCPCLFLAQFDSSLYIRIDLRKVSTEDSDHVISYMVVLIIDIEGNCFYIIFSVLLS